MFREPVLLTYRRPSNSLFCAIKIFCVFHQGNQRQPDGFYQHREKTARRTVLFGRFLLSGRWFQQRCFNPFEPDCRQFPRKNSFYDQYWLEHLEEQAYYCNLAKDALLKGNLKTLTEIFPQKWMFTANIITIPKNGRWISWVFIDYFFTHDMDSEQVLASIILLLRELEIDPNKTFLEPDTKLMESICHLYLSRYWVPDEGMVAFILGALISEGADYQVYYKGKHFVMWVSESLTPQALKIINDMASELNLSYVVFEAEYATFKFLLPSKYLDQNLYFDPDKTGDFLADFKTAAPGSIEQVLPGFYSKSVRFVGDEEYDEWIEMLDSLRCAIFLPGRRVPGNGLCHSKRISQKTERHSEKQPGFGVSKFRERECGGVCAGDNPLVQQKNSPNPFGSERIRLRFRSKEPVPSVDCDSRGAGGRLCLGWQLVGLWSRYLHAKRRLDFTGSARGKKRFRFVLEGLPNDESLAQSAALSRKDASSQCVPGQQLPNHPVFAWRRIQSQYGGWWGGHAFNGGADYRKNQLSGYRNFVEVGSDWFEFPPYGMMDTYLPCVHRKALSGSIGFGLSKDVNSKMLRERPQPPCPTFGNVWGCRGRGRILSGKLSDIYESIGC